MAVSLYYLNVTVHVLAAVLWLGGMFFLAAVGAPVLRQLEPTLRAELFRRLGERFRRVGWVAIAVLVITGVGNLYFRGLISWAVLGSWPFWSTSYGHALAWKLAAVAAMVGVSGLHDFVLGPAASRAGAGTPQAARLRRKTALLARLNAVFGVVVVIAAVRLARGG